MIYNDDIKTLRGYTKTYYPFSGDDVRENVREELGQSAKPETRNPHFQHEELQVFADWLCESSRDEEAELVRNLFFYGIPLDIKIECPPEYPDAQRCINFSYNVNKAAKSIGVGFGEALERMTIVMNQFAASLGKLGSSVSNVQRALGSIGEKLQYAKNKRHREKFDYPKWDPSKERQSKKRRKRNRRK